MKIQHGLPLCLLATLGAALCGCNSVSSLEPAQLSPLQIRAIETRSYDSQDARAMLKTVLNVLEDEGFLVDYGNSELGLLHASRTLVGTDATRNYSRAVDLFGLSNIGATGNGLIIEATANVSDFGKQIKVRITFQRKLNAPNGPVFSATPVTDPRIYQEFFAKLDRGLFIQKQGL